jgi:O-antigen/teichoic acid export membrane protein
MLKSIFSNWFGMLVLGVISVILTPAMIHHLGNMYFGMWALAGSVLDYSGLLDMGMRSTLFRYVAYYRGANERKKLNETFVTGMVIALVAACVCFSVFLCLASILPAFFKFAGDDRTTFGLLIVLMGASTSVLLPGHFLAAYLRGLERFDLYNLGATVYGVVRAILLLTLLKLGYGIRAVAWGVLAAAVLHLWFQGLLVRRADLNLEISLKQLNWKRTSEMFNFGFYSFLYNSGEALRYYTDSFVIGRMLAVALVTPFSVATRLMEYFKMIAGGVSGPIMVRLSELSGKELDVALREEFLRSTRFSMLLSVFVGGLMILDGKAIIRLWMGPDFIGSYQILLVLTVAYIVTWGQVSSPLLLFARARHHRALSWWTLVEGAANLFLSILWAPRYGLLGVAFGTAVPLLISKLFVQPWYVLKDLGMSTWEYLKGGLARATLAGVAFLGVSWFFSPSVSSPVTYSSLFYACVWQTLLFVILSFLFGLSKTDRRTVKTVGRRFAMSFGIARSL